MPFIAYRGKLEISREMVTFDSHNSEQALLISSYFNSLEKEEDINLSRMYDLLIKAWNQEIPPDHPVMKAFQYTRAQTVLLLLDTMDVITGKVMLDNDHLFLQENENIWRALGQASSWTQAERNYNALEINADAAGAVPESRCYTVEDLQSILMISKSSVYALLKKKEFRWIRVGRSGYRISRKSFDEWLDHTA